MATVTKDFKVKSGLIVEGASATVNNYDILTKKAEDQSYIVDLIGGTATPLNTPDSVVKRDANGNFAAGVITADSITLDGDNLAGLISSAQQNAESYADNLATNYDAAGSASAAQTAAESYTDSAISQETQDRNYYIGVAQSTAESYTDTAISNLNLSGTYDALGAASTAESNANSYTDGKVANLVDSAPDLLNTLNELAAAIADNPNYATDVANLVSTKADTTYVDGLAANYDASGAAATAESNANSYTDSAINTEISNRDGAISSAVSDLNNTISGLTTDNIAEGNNKYYTNAQVRDVLTTSIQTNISITEDGSNLVITAENGVADSTTSDLAEGSNLYFTDARAIAALEGITPSFTEIDVNSVAKQIASTQSVAVASQVVGYMFANTDYRSAEFTVKIASGTHTDISKVIVTLDSSNNVAITEYAVVGTNGALSTVTADVNAGNVRLLVTTVNNNSVVTVVGTLLI